MTMAQKWHTSSTEKVVELQEEDHFNYSEEKHRRTEYEEDIRSIKEQLQEKEKEARRQ